MKSIKIGVIPAAGVGKRMGYLGSILPKPLFPLYDKPIIHHIIDNMINVGITTIYVPVFHEKDKIIGYFNKIKDTLPINIEFIPLEKITAGIAKTIALTENFISEPFMVILGDDCTITNSLENLISSFFSHKSYVTEGVVHETDKKLLNSTCCVKLDNGGWISDIIEKPENPPTDIRGCGVYVFDSSVFDYIRRTPVSSVRGEIEITDTIKILAKEKKASAEFIKGVNININNYDDLLRAWLEYKKLVLKKSEDND